MERLKAHSIYKQPGSNTFDQEESCDEFIIDLVKVFIFLLYKFLLPKIYSLNSVHLILIFSNEKNTCFKGQSKDLI